MQGRSALCPVQIGREREVASLAGEAAVGRVTLISGEAGVGKSLLAREALRLADEKGMARLVGNCAPDSAIPYAPFVTAIRRRTRTLDHSALNQLFGGPASLAALLLPEVARVVEPPSTSPHQEDLFAGVWQLLARLAAPGGCLLLLEDLHWADPDSLRLVGYLARESSDLPVWLVATYRSDELHRRHPLTGLLAELARERRTEEVRLAPLDRASARAMLSAIFDGTDIGDEFLDAVLDRTDGNPFFIEELVKVLVERGDIYHQGEEWARRDLAEIEMPLTVRESLLARARTLEPAAVQVLQLAALAGEQLDLPVLARAATTEIEQVEDVVRDGLRLQLLTERRDGGRSGYAFRHALSREAFADELVGPDRQHAHRRLAEAIVGVHSDDLDAVAAELADHYTEAGEPGPAVEYGIRAARRAVASFALGEAARLYDRGLRLLPQEADNRLDLLVEAGEAVLFDTDRRLAVAFASEARELARRRADALAESRALQVMQRDAWLSGDSLRGIAFASEARELLRGRGDREEARALARLVRLLTLADRRSEALEMLPGAIELARQSGSFGWLSMLEGTRMLLASEDSEFDHAYRSAVAAAQAGNDLGAEQNLAANAGYTRIWYGELERSRGYFQRAIELNERFTPYDPYPQAGYAWLLSLLGDYGEAVRYADPLRGRGQIPTRIVALTARYEVAERRGEPEAGALADELWAIARSTGESQRSVPAVAARARNALVHGGLDAAAPLFRAALERTTTELVTGSHWMFSPDFAYALAEEERVDELAHWVDDVGKLTRGDPNAQNLAAQALCDGYLAAARGQPGEARLLFTAAATRYRSLPCPAREVEALLGLADVEWQAHRAEESLAAAQSAVELAERIGASVLARRAEDARIRAEAPTVLASVLFTDIVGSTERAAELGDRAWKELLERHHALVRRELTRWHGREIDTAGDGFLAAFDSPAQAIRCACAIRDALAAAGVPIRAGLHTGECQQSREKLTGIAVHVAARVNAAARPGEVLVSATVRDLVAGSGFAFEDRGMHVLKGVPGDWRLFAVSR